MNEIYKVYFIFFSQDQDMKKMANIHNKERHCVLLKQELHTIWGPVSLEAGRSLGELIAFRHLLPKWEWNIYESKTATEIHLIEK